MHLKHVNTQPRTRACVHMVIMAQTSARTQQIESTHPKTRKCPYSRAGDTRENACTKQWAHRTVQRPKSMYTRTHANTTACMRNAHTGTRTQYSFFYFHVQRRCELKTVLIHYYKEHLNQQLSNSPSIHSPNPLFFTQAHHWRQGTKKKMILSHCSSYCARHTFRDHRRKWNYGF